MAKRTAQDHEIVRGGLSATWWDATGYVGTPCWIAAIEDERGSPSKLLDTSEHDDEAAARAWADRELRVRLGEAGP